MLEKILYTISSIYCYLTHHNWKLLNYTTQLVGVKMDIQCSFCKKEVSFMGDRYRWRNLYSFKIENRLTNILILHELQKEYMRKSLTAKHLDDC